MSCFIRAAELACHLQCHSHGLQTTSYLKGSTASQKSTTSQGPHLQTYTNLQEAFLYLTTARVEKPLLKRGDLEGIQAQKVPGSDVIGLDSKETANSCQEKGGGASGAIPQTSSHEGYLTHVFASSRENVSLEVDWMKRGCRDRGAI